jgi:hypothetical protein
LHVTLSKKEQLANKASLRVGLKTDFLEFLPVGKAPSTACKIGVTTVNLDGIVV